MKLRHWTTNDEAYLRVHYGSDGAANVAAALKRTPSAVRSRAHRMGVPIVTAKYQGKPCLRGHLGVWYVSNWNCVECPRT